jgi:L-alanine-DL-glutamate epimerase-like enolase superfamily enzyme
MTQTSRAGPRVVSITTYGVNYPLAAPMADAVHHIPGRAALLVEVACDDGRVGTGESAIYGGTASVTEALVHDVLAPRVLGGDPTRPELLWQRMLWPSHQLGTGGALPMAIAGVDIAVWDLLGQLAGLPLFRLLGGHQTRVRAYASGGFYFDGKDASALAEEFKGYAARGYGHGKMKVGRTPETPMNPLVHMNEPGFAAGSLADDLARVRAVRQALGDDFRLMVDANNAWDVATALDVPVAGYETESQLSGFRDLIAAGAVDIVQPDVIWAGGITTCRRIAALAYAAGLPCVPHVYSTAVSIAANLHFMASLPNCYLLEYDQNPNALRTELLTEPIEPDAGAVVTVPERPGLGIRLDRTTLDRYRTAPPRTSELP